MANDLWVMYNDHEITFDRKKSRRDIGIFDKSDCTIQALYEMNDIIELEQRILDSEMEDRMLEAKTFEFAAELDHLRKDVMVITKRLQQIRAAERNMSDSDDEDMHTNVRSLLSYDEVSKDEQLAQIEEDLWQTHQMVIINCKRMRKIEKGDYDLQQKNAIRERALELDLILERLQTKKEQLQQPLTPSKLCVSQ